MGGSTVSFCHRSEKVLTYWMTAERSRSEISCQVGIAVPQRPCVTVRKRSASVGRESLSGVDRNLKMPRVKSRGRGFKNTADGPLPSPLAP